MARRLVRRSKSTTSLSKYFHDLPDPDQTSLDFCNSFWGPNDCGVEVLFARMRGAARTMEEMREFWKERIAIEAEYAKKLAKLAKRPLGRDEIGGFRSALDKLLSETDGQAAQHFNSAQTMKRELEKASNEFIGKQNNHKATFQAAIEKSYKTKQFQERNVEKARKKYEADSALVDSYTALLTLPQSDALNDTQTKLERAERDAQAHQKDYKNFTQTLEDTCRRWEGEWKTYCDQCQDLEDERLEYIKDNVWAYANVLSTVCVADDESCERVRVCLEEIDVDKDIENFVNDYGTGSMISEPMSFVRHGQGDTINGPKQKMAKFLRTSVRGASPSAQSPSSVGLFGAGTTGPALNVHIGWGGGEESHNSNLGDSPPLPPLPLTPPIALLNISTSSLISEAPENNVNPDSLHESDVKLKACVQTDPEGRSDGRLWDLTSVSRWIDNVHMGFFALNRRDIVKLLTISLLFGTVGMFISEHYVRKINEVHPVVYVPKADAATTSGPSCCNR
ncbi:hypothetical protein M407DRAFT_21964 [Tulasnella calospora MUT 4182]|uniref:F-BAR domain-containing protein n=1 Tax=Tulasnella calospora MUT 4182 TaxID=1051891 RepID=A0A0C3M5H0_9AGAM|nr:hypothetical protein M407DRAFT_21964 [Tulasnella calospora MUT 4182]